MPKPVKKKKKFIRKKDSTTYRLIPGYVDDDEEDVRTNETADEIQARKEEEKKYGIFYDDSYNYMKHLRSLDEQATLVSTESFRVDADDEARSTVSRPPVFMEFFSTDDDEETRIDPDILAALEEAPVVKITEEDEVEVAGIGDDFLDDDFIVKAGGAVPATDMDDNSEGSFISDEEEDDDLEEEEEEDEEDDSDFIVSDEDEITDGLSPSKPSQGRGNREDDIVEAQTALILKNFEEGFGFRCSNQLSDEEDETPTFEDYENLKHILKKDKLQQQVVSWSEVLDDKSERPKIDTSKYIYEDVDEFEWKDAPPSKPSFDCVSILSLNSNTRNLPTDLIPQKTQTKKKQQHSVGDTESTSAPGMTLSQLEAEMRESRKADKASTFRPKDESMNEKKARKKAVKEERRERRQEKKANKEVFATENEKMKKEAASLAKSVKSVKIC